MMNVDPTETGLAARVRAGDQDALAELYGRYGQYVMDAAFTVTGSADDAEDVLQDVFVGLPEALRTYDGSGSLGHWLRRLATRTALLRMRSDRRRVRWQGVVALAGRSSDRQQSAEARLTLQRWLDRMPSDWRVVYVLKEIEGHTHGEIAGLLGITTGASEVRLHRARRFLKERLRGKL